MAEITEEGIDVAEVEIPGWMRTLAIIVGVVSIVASIIVIIYPASAIATLITLLAFGLLLIGIGRLTIGISGIEIPGWMRTLAIIVGVASIVASIIVIIYPAIAIAILVMLLAFGLLLIGIERLANGISGRTYIPVAHRRVTTA